MRIDDLDAGDADLLESLAALTHKAAARHAPNWLPTMADAREEVSDATAPGHVTRVMFRDNEPLGWVSCFHVYGKVWEIHPIVVAVEHHREGCGSQLLRDVEMLAARRGAGVLFASTSDETGATSLTGHDLFADPIRAMATLTADPTHAVGFWLRMGYALVGVLPDAEGPGLPSIQFAKRPPPVS